MVYSNEQIRLINKLKSIYNDSDYKVQDEGLYEWKIEDWKNVSTNFTENSPEFYANGNKWILKLYSRGSKGNNYEYVSLFLKKENKDNDYSNHIPVRFVFFVRDYYDYSNIHYEKLPIQYYTVNERYWGYSILLKSVEMVKYLNGYNKCVFGVFYSFYQYYRAQFQNEIKITLFDEREKKSIVSKCFYEWKIYDWKSLSNSESSQIFYSGGFQWKIELKKTINFFKKKNISIFLKCLNPGNNDIFVRYSLFKRNSDYPECCYYNLNKEIIENNKCVVGVYFEIYEERKDDNGNNQNQKIEKEKTGRELRETIEELREKIEKELRGTFERELKEKIESELRKKMESELREKIETELKEKIERELKGTIENELREKIEKELKENIEKELRGKIEKELREKFERENLNKIQPINYIPFQYYPSYYLPPSSFYPLSNVNPNSGVPLVYYNSPNVNPNQDQNIILTSTYPPNQNPNPIVPSAPANIIPNQSDVFINNTPPINPNQGAVYVSNTPPTSPNQSNVLVNNTQPITPNQGALFFNPYIPNISADQQNTSSVDKKD